MSTQEDTVRLFEQYTAQRNERLPSWIQTTLAVVAVIASVLMAYSNLDKRIALVEQKIDFIVQQVKRP